MTSRLAGGARICGEQDCNERTNRPDHPLCYTHWLDSQDGDIDECPNHQGVYKPPGYPICRSCYRQNQEPAQATPTTISQRPQDDSRGWNRQATLPPESPPPTNAVEAVERVRRNLERSESVNHESNTIQFLITPLLRGLGWDDYDPEQVIREYKPAGHRRSRQSIAVDIALLEKGVPKVFIEAKRLDREHTQEYDEQLAKYASHLEDGIAALTNGRYWQVYVVSNGNPVFQGTIDVAEGDAEYVARELNKVIGRAVLIASPQRWNRPETAATRPGRETIAENLRQYREREAGRRRQPAYTVFNNATIELIADQHPTDLEQLGNIRGIGPSTLRQHGDAIIKIVRGEG